MTCMACGRKPARQGGEICGPCLRETTSQEVRDILERRMSRSEGLRITSYVLTEEEVESVQRDITDLLVAAREGRSICDGGSSGS